MLVAKYTRMPPTLEAALVALVDQSLRVRNVYQNSTGHTVEFFGQTLEWLGINDEIYTSGLVLNDVSYDVRLVIQEVSEGRTSIVIFLKEREANLRFWQAFLSTGRHADEAMLTYEAGSEELPISMEDLFLVITSAFEVDTVAA